ncbi:MAG: alpha/beta fold hydrolase [Chitinivibrionales bacterium]|nr:alpha/beta fold hydrolase [Chitinivibrionales bacterium]
MIMQKLLTRIFMFVLKSAVFLAPREACQKKIEEINCTINKIQEYNLHGWSYRSVISHETQEQYWYYEAGPDTAPVLVCIHGLMLDGRTFVKLNRYLRDYRIIAINMPEQSSLYTGSIENFLTIIVDFLRSVNVRECDLMGVSFGGVVATHLVAHLPEDIAVRRLVLASSVIAGATRSIRNSVKVNHEWIRSVPDYQIYWFFEQLINFVKNTRGQKSGDEELVEFLRVKHPAYYRQVFEALANYQGLEDACRIFCPVIVMNGEKDMLIDKEMRNLMKHIFDGKRYFTIPEASHEMMFTKTELVARHMENFFTRTRRPVPATGINISAVYNRHPVTRVK